MGKAAGAVIGVVEIAAGVLLATPSSGLSTALISGGASMLLGYAASLLINPSRSPLLPIGASYTGTLEPPAKPPATLEELDAIYLSPLK